MFFFYLQIDLFVEHLQAPTVNDKIFPNIVSGFMDTNPVVRESTIKVSTIAITFAFQVTRLKGYMDDICSYYTPGIQSMQKGYIVFVRSVSLSVRPSIHLSGCDSVR